MSYLDVKTQFLGLLNRRDITPTLLTTFLQYGIQRIQRELRVPAMETIGSYVTDGSAVVLVPANLLEVIAIYTNDQTNRQKLIRTDLQSIIDYSNVPGSPKFYFREGNKFILGPCPPTGTTVWIDYYSDASSLSADTDTNWLTDVAPTLLIYAALSYAADYFLDDRKQLFEASYMQIAEQLTFMAQQDELQNASVSTAYDSNPSYIGPFYGRI